MHVLAEHSTDLYTHKGPGVSVVRLVTYMLNFPLYLYLAGKERYEERGVGEPDRPFVLVFG